MNNGRALIVFFSLFIMFILLSVNLFNLQVTKHEKYKFLAERQQNATDVIRAQRGFIRDRNNDILAITNDDISFYVDTRMLKEGEAEKIANKFSKIFGKDKKYYLGLIKSGKKNVCIEKKASKDKALLVGEFTIDALYKTEDYSRIYPYGSLASHVLGYVNKKSKGIAGIEKQLNDELTGENGYRAIERDVLGRMVSVNDELSKQPISGKNIVLTINKNYQKILEEELSKGLEFYEGKSAAGIIMDPNNGEILAMTSLPSYDPANYNLFPDSTLRNRVLTDTYEPGSTMKSVVMSILLEEGLVREEEEINTENGKYRIRGATIRDEHKYEKLNVKEILEHSSNVGIVKLSDRIDENSFYKYLRDFGFGNKTSINLPGETAGLLKKPDSYSGISKSFISHGYEISVTPLQVISAFSALVNGGNLYSPIIIKNIVDSKGNIVESNKANRIRSVISETTSNKIKEFMIGVVEEGTGTAAQLDNVLVGGKTGTAQKLINGKYTNKAHNSSFVGFFPADNPSVICLILVDSPQKGKYGGQVAAPIFNKVAKRIVASDESIVPNKEVIERDKNKIEHLFASLNYSENEDNKFVSANFADIKTDSKKTKNVIDKSKMPDLTNLSLRNAVSKITQLGLKYKVLGNGKVVHQSIEAGNKISNGDLVLITCRTTNKLKSIRIN